MAKTDSSSAQTTTDHDEIRRWIEDRDGRPATVKGTSRGDHAGVLRVDFQEPDEDLQQIDWDTFFEKFESEDLAFLHGEGDSRFNKFVER